MYGGGVSCGSGKIKRTMRGDTKMICSDCMHVLVRTYLKEQPDYFCLLDHESVGTRLDKCSRHEVISPTGVNNLRNCAPIDAYGLILPPMLSSITPARKRVGWPKGKPRGKKIC